jgi:hypothetical protein
MTAAKQAEEAEAVAAVAAAQRAEESEGVLAELDSLELDSLEAEVRAAEREVLAAEAAAAAAADRAMTMVSDGMGVTEEAAEAAFWGVNAIPEGKRGDDPWGMIGRRRGRGQGQKRMDGGHAACAVWGCGRMSWAGRRKGEGEGEREGERGGAGGGERGGEGGGEGGDRGR